METAQSSGNVKPVGEGAVIPSSSSIAVRPCKVCNDFEAKGPSFRGQYSTLTASAAAGCLTCGLLVQGCQRFVHAEERSGIPGIVSTLVSLFQGCMASQRTKERNADPEYLHTLLQRIVDAAN